MTTVRRVILASVCATFVAASTAQAQHAAFGTGNWLVGGSAGLSRSHSDGSDDDQTSLSISPSLLYFFTPQLAIGASANIGHSSAGDSKFTQFGVGPAVRFYFINTPNNVRPYAGVSVGISHDKNTTNLPSGASVETTSNSINPDVAVGLTYMLSDDVGILNELYFTQRSSKTKVGSGASSDSKGNAFGLRFGLNIILH